MPSQAGPSAARRIQGDAAGAGSLAALTGPCAGREEARALRDPGKGLAEEMVLSPHPGFTRQSSRISSGNRDGGWVFLVE